MRYVCQATAVAVLSFLVTSEARGQDVPGLSITNYQFVSEQRWSRTHSYVTYRAHLVNTGAARDAVTATVSSLTPAVEIVPGQSNLRFSPVPAGATVASLNTFTLLVDRTVSFDFKNIKWSFLTPWAVAGSNQTVRIGDVVTLNGSRSSNPSGAGVMSYRWSFVSRPFGTTARLTGADNVIASFTADVPGEYLLQLTVSNGFGSDSATVTISTTNSPPVANAGANTTVGLGATVLLNGSASSDADGNPLTYSWTFLSIPQGSAAVLLAPNTVNPSFIADKAGAYIVQLIVNDGRVNSAPATVQVSTTNTAPVASAGPNQSVRTGAVVQLNGSGSTDVDGDPLTYRWQFNSVPAGSKAVLSNASAVNPTFTADAPGTYVVQLIVRDGAKDSAPATVTITTDVIQAPTANAGSNQTVKRGDLVMLNGSGTDPQALPLTYQWSMTTKPAASSAALSSLTSPRPTFSADYPGQYVLQLIVFNGYVPSPASTVTITTTNTAPVANAGPDQIAQIGATVSLTGAASSDADGDTLQFSWSLISKPANSSAVLSSASVVSPAFVADVAGTYVAQLIVSDGFVNSSPATVTISAGVRTITLSPSPLNVPRGQIATLTVTLGGAAGPGGVDVRLSSSDPGVIGVPSNVLVPQGQATASVSVTAGAAGSALILATATGFSAGSVTANVTVPAVTLALDSPVIGLTAGTNATVTLSSPVPQGGLTVLLSAQPPGVVNIPPSLTIASGSTGSFTATGAGIGSATITASVPGFTSGFANVSVSNLGAIRIAPNVTVGPNRTTPLGISLLTPAPVGGVRITLVSSAPTIATVSESVFIPQGALVPQGAAELTGITFGSATITASAPGFESDSKLVRVTAALSFNPASLTLGAGGTGTLTLHLSSPAPAGLVVDLASVNAAVATVPATVAFTKDATTASFTVTGVASGNTTIRASALPNLAETTATVNVAVLGSIVLPSGASVALGQTAPFPVSLSVPAPAGGTTITLTSADPTKLTIAPSTVTVEAGKTAPLAQPQITGKAPGTINVNASAPAFGSASAAVSVTAGLSFAPSTLTLAPGGTGSVSVNLPAPSTSPVTVSLTSDNTAVVTVPPTLTIPANGVGAGVTITGVAVGSTRIRATSAGLIAAELPVTVQTGAAINLPVNPSVPLGGSTAFPVTLSQPAASQITISLASSDPAKVSISPASVIINQGQTAPETQPQITGVSVSDANITATAAGHSSASRSVRVTASVSFQPAAISISGISKQNVTIRLSALTPVPLTITLGSATPAVATVPASVTIPANSSSASVQVSGVSVGSAVLHAGAAPNIPDATANVTVASAGAISVPANTSVALSGTAPFAIALPAPAPADVVVALSSSDPATVSVSPASVTIPAGSSGPASQPQVSGLKLGTANINASAPGYTAAAGAVRVTASLSFTPASLTVGRGGSRTLNLNLSAPTPVPVSISLSSDNAAIAAVPATVTIPANSVGVAVTVTGVAAGATTIRATGPTGVTGAEAAINVGGDIVLPAELTVAPGEQAVLSVSLAAPAATTVFLQLATSDAAKATLQQTAVVIQAGQKEPAFMPRVNGISYGTATITATAEGLAPASTAVTVGGALSFGQASVTLAPTTNFNLGVSLSSSAPPAGVLVNLTSSDPAVASVPASVTIAGGQSGVLVQLSAVALGTATITATTAIPTVAGATMSVTVATPGLLTLPAGFSVPMGESLTYPVSLSSAAGASGVTVALTASSPLISFVPLVCVGSPCPPVPSNATQTSVFIAAGQTTPSVQPQVRGVSPGQVTVTASAPGYASINRPVQVTGSFAFSTASVSVAPGGTGTLFLVLSGAAPPPPTGLTVNLSSSSPGVATVQTSVTAFWDGSSPTTLNIPVNAIAAGTTTIRASSPNMADATATVIVAGPLAISTSSLPSAIEKRAYSATVTAGGGKSPYTWSATGLPAGLSMAAATGVISGTPSSTGASSVSITVADSTTPTPQTVSRSLSLSVAPALAIANSSLPGAVVGSAYSATLSPANGSAPYTWQAAGLPSGLSINSSTGAITGTPTSPGLASVQITLTDSTSPPQTAVATLGINVIAGLGITTASLPGGAVNAPYNAQVAAAGGLAPYSWSATGLPSGLSLNANTGAITGAPLSAGTSNVTIQVADATAPTAQTASRNFSIVITTGLSITSSALPAAVASSPYTVTLAAAGGTTPYTWSATGLPGGLSLNPATGVISGTPAAAGSVTVNLSVTDSSAPTPQNAAKSLTLLVRPALAITTTSLATGAAGSPYSTALAATGGTAPYTWSVTGLPAGLNLNTATGAISGTPAAASTNTLNITVTDSSAPAVVKTGTLTLVIVGPLSVTTTALPPGIVGVSYSASLAASGGTTPYTWAATGLPAGLTFNTATGAISGTPAAAGSSNVAITVTDSTGPVKLTASANLTLTVAAALSISTASLPPGTAGAPYSAAVVATGGTPPYTWSAANLPAGLNLNAATGAITGSPSAAGTVTVAFTATDSSATRLSVSRSLSLAIAPALSIATASLPGGAVGSAYSVTLAATGGNPPYSWTATGLPAGLSLNASTGVISGSPAAAGSSNVSIGVADSTTPASATASRSLSLAVVPALTITTAALPGGVAQLAYSATVAATGGNTPYTWSATGLPPGLSINASTGVITGTPTAAGSSNATISVADSTNPAKLNASKQLPITIGAALAITTTALPSGSVNAPYTTTIAASGGTPPYTFAATGLPAGLSINASTGQVSGVPSAAGTATVNATVTDSSAPVKATVARNLSLAVSPPVPASVTPTFGGGQTAVILTGFASQLQVSVKDAANQPVAGALVTFTAPSGGASLTFATGGNTATITTTAAGLATSPQMTANGTPGSYNVTATVGLLSPAVFSLTNSAGGGLGQISVGNASIGQNLQRAMFATLPAAAGPGGIELTITSADSARLRLGGNGVASIKIAVPEGQTQIGFLAHGLGSSGSVNVTATADGYQGGTGVVTLTPSGFVLAGPNDVGATFQTFVGVNTPITIWSARLDATGKYVEKQSLRASLGAAVTVNLSSTSAGTVNPLSVTLNPGDQSADATFRGAASGLATVTASAPSGFATPSDNTHTLQVNVQASALILPSGLTVGRNLQVPATVNLNGVVGQGGLLMTITSSDPSRLLVSASPTAAGSGSITLTLFENARATPEFYFQGAASTGTVNFSATAPGFGSASGSVTLAPSGIVFTNPFGGVPNPILAAAGGNSVPVTIYAAVLNATGAWVQTQALAGGMSATVTVSNTGTAGVGSVNPAQVTIPGGSAVASTRFEPGSQGSTTLAVTVPGSPVGFATPALSYRTLPVSVTTSRIILTATDLSIGRDLQVEGAVILNQPAPAGGLAVTLTSNSSQLRLSATATGAGQNSLLLTVPAGSSSAAYFVQALGDTGLATYRASAAGYLDGTGEITLAPSGVVLSDEFTGLPLVSIPSGSNTVKLRVQMAQLDPSTAFFVAPQALRGGLSLNVTLRTGNTGIATVDSPVTIAGGADPATITTTVRRAGAGSTTVTADQPPGYTPAANPLMSFNPMPTIQLTVN